MFLILVIKGFTQAWGGVSGCTSSKLFDEKQDLANQRFFSSALSFPDWTFSFTKKMKTFNLPVVHTETSHYHESACNLERNWLLKAIHYLEILTCSIHRFLFSSIAFSFQIFSWKWCCSLLVCTELSSVVCLLLPLDLRVLSASVQHPANYLGFHLLPPVPLCYSTCTRKI